MESYTQDEITVYNLILGMEKMEDPFGSFCPDNPKEIDTLGVKTILEQLGISTEWLYCGRDPGVPDFFVKWESADTYENEVLRPLVPQISDSNMIGKFSERLYFWYHMRIQQRRAHVISVIQTIIEKLRLECTIVWEGVVLDRRFCEKLPGYCIWAIQNVGLELGYTEFFSGLEGPENIVRINRSLSGINPMFGFKARAIERQPTTGIWDFSTIQAEFKPYIENQLSQIIDENSQPKPHEHIVPMLLYNELVSMKVLHRNNVESFQKGCAIYPTRCEPWEPKVITFPTISSGERLSPGDIRIWPSDLAPLLRFPNANFLILGLGKSAQIALSQTAKTFVEKLRQTPYISVYVGTTQQALNKYTNLVTLDPRGAQSRVVALFWLA